ncbi:MAG: hypothetical protein H6657_24570 [Ardenticatenaceae bacterium]|nr:hypothetical protein [Ardenticatenaceae bacterium]
MPTPFVTCKSYRLADLEHAQQMLRAIGLWQELFNEPFPACPVTLDTQATAVVITRLLAQVWETRYPIWLEDTRYAEVTNLIHSLQTYNLTDDPINLALNPHQLDCFQVYLTLGEHYANYFPDDITWLAELTLLNEDCLSQSVANFLAAINRDYFPVQDDVWIEDVDHLAWLLEQIYIEPQGYELDADFVSDLDDYQEPLRTLLSLASDDPVEDLPDISLHGLDEIIAAMPLPQPIRDHLPVMIKLVTHNTDNPWLDWSYGDLAQGYFMLPEWNVENVAYLKEEWEGAKALVAQEMAFVHWVHEELPTRLTAVRSAIYLAYMQTMKGVYHEDRPHYSHPLSRSDHSGKSTGRWIAREPSRFTSGFGRAAKPDTAFYRTATS